LISWTSTGTVSNVEIDLYKGDALASAIASNEMNDGQYTWAVPSTIGLGADYRIVISSSDNSSVADSSDGTFSIGSVAEQPAETQSTTLPVVVSVVSLVVAIAAIAFALRVARSGRGKE
jgi:hypothetical protein